MSWLSLLFDGVKLAREYLKDESGTPAKEHWQRIRQESADRRQRKLDEAKKAAGPRPPSG